MTALAPPKFVWLVAVVLGAEVAGAHSSAGADPWFGGYDCSGDCSDAAAGYDWAELHDIDDGYDCPQADPKSFTEGCQVRAQNPLRGSERDDAGQFIIKHEQFLRPTAPTK
jgi:hypothetical protein